MKKTLTRFQAQKMLEVMGGMALGHLATEELEKVMDAFDTLKKEVEKIDTLKTELAKRLYQGVDEKRLQEFFAAIQKNEEGIEDKYADLVPLRQKEVQVIIGILNKEAEVEIDTIDGKEFRKAVMKAQPDTKTAVFELLTPLFTEEEKEEADLSELDEFLK